MPRLTYYAEGQYNMACDQCGRGFKSSEISKRWDNAMVCSACWEPRHPQDFVRGVRDDPSVPIARPRSGLPGAPGIWVNNSSVVVLWLNNAGNVVPWIDA